MSRYSKKLIEHTKKVWQDLSEDKLSTQDAIEIIANTIELFDLLEELERKYAKSEANIQYQSH